MRQILNATPRSSTALKCEVRDLYAALKDIFSHLAHNKWPRLTKLNLSDGGFVLEVPDQRSSACTNALIEAVARATPKLEHLELSGHLFLSKLTHPTVKTAVFRGEAWSGLFEGAGGFQKLESLTLHYGADVHGVSRGAVALSELFSGALTPRLRVLDLHRASFDPEPISVIELLAKSPLLRRLETLELTVDVEALDSLAVRAAKFRHLRTLKLHGAYEHASIRKVLKASVVFTLGKPPPLQKVLARMAKSQQSFASDFTELQSAMSTTPWPRTLTHDQPWRVLFALTQANRVDDAMKMWLLFRLAPAKVREVLGGLFARALASLGRVDDSFEVLAVASPEGSWGADELSALPLDAAVRFHRRLLERKNSDLGYMTAALLARASASSRADVAIAVGQQFLAKRDDALVRLELAVALIHLGKSPPAKTDGVALLQRVAPHEPIEVVKRAVRFATHSTDSSAIFQAGDALLRRARITRGKARSEWLAAAKKVLERGPRTDEIIGRQLWVLVLQEDAKAAMGLAKSVLTRKVNNPEVYRFMAWAFAIGKDFNHALRCVQLAKDADYDEFAYMVDDAPLKRLRANALFRRSG